MYPSIAGLIGWSDLLGVNCFEGDENIIRSDFNDQNAVLSELTQLLANDAVLDRMYLDYLVYKLSIYLGARKCL